MHTTAQTLSEAELALLGRAPLLQGVSAGTPQQLAARAVFRSLSAGTPLIKAEEYGETLYLLLAGELAVYLPGPGRHELARILPGETVGEQSLIDGRPHSAEVVAISDARVMALPGAVLWRLMQDQPAIALNLLRLLSLRMRHSNAELGDAFQLQQELQLAAETDALTGLHNRRWMEQMFPRVMRRNRHEANALSLLMIDIDHFKRVNDSYGHVEGDQVLRHTASLIRSMLRPGDLCARYGGEEFCALLPDVDQTQAMHIAERLREALASTRFTLGSGASITVEVSIGMAQWDKQASLSQLQQQADQALYIAKQNGRNRVVSFDATSDHSRS
jgi:diguanylate cyclase (GGDEF)-like protein